MAQTESSISRRDLLRKGAVAGAVAWTAPVVLSSPAFAATGKCGGSKPCVDFYLVKPDNGGCADDRDPACEPTLDLTQVGCDPAEPPTLKRGGCTGVVGDFNTENDDPPNTGWVTLPAGAIPVALAVKPGSCHWVYADGSGTFTNTTITGGCQVQFLEQKLVDGKPFIKFQLSGCQGLSHFSIVYCL